MEIRWIRCYSYDDAKTYTQVIYMHEMGGKPYYWGKCDRTQFGGAPRLQVNGVKRNGRYNPSYRHWIDAVLASGGGLFIGKPSAEARGQSLADIEHTLVSACPAPGNRRRTKGNRVANLRHTGDVPDCLKA